MCKQQSEDEQRPLGVPTRSHCEQLVCDQLAAKGFHMFLPKIDTWSRRAGKRHLISVPMFPSYLFCQHAIEKSSSIEVRKARGLVRILGESWEKPSIVPDAEIEAIQATLRASIPACPSYLQEGQRVRITEGSLRGWKAFYCRANPRKGC
jgi:transcription antitermination factor NusG